MDFIPFEDFSVVEDIDNVLNYKEAIVRCIAKEDEKSFFDIKYGKEYKAIGIRNGNDNKLEYLVKDESSDCYFYQDSIFEILKDIDGILNKESGIYVYDCSIFAN